MACFPGSYLRLDDFWKEVSRCLRLRFLELALEMSESDPIE